MHTNCKLCLVAFFALAVVSASQETDNKPEDAEPSIAEQLIESVEKNEGEPAMRDDYAAAAESAEVGADEQHEAGGVDAGEEESADDEESEESEDATSEEDDDRERNAELISAQFTPAHMKSLYKQLDVNHDGKVSMLELLDFAHDQSDRENQYDSIYLEEADQDKDGKVQLSELLPEADADEHSMEEEASTELLPKADAELQKTNALETAKFKAADKDGDGALDASEVGFYYAPETDDEVLSSVAAATLKARDVDGNGKLTNLEFLELQGGADGKQPTISEEDSADFALLDKDSDGALDATELKAWESGRFSNEKSFKKLFELADRDEDSMLTLEELQDDHYEIARSELMPTLYQWATGQDL